jgi:hypothetical protein
VAYSNKPIFVAVPRTTHARISTANTARNGSGTLGTLVTGAGNGTRVEKITITATGTTTAGMVRLFISDGSNTRAVGEVPVTAITPSASLAAFSAELVRTDGLPYILVPLSWTLKAGTHNGEEFDLVAECGDL